MNRQQLEVVVIQAVQNARNGASVEDDGVELKRDWPDPRKARQLAGSANRLNGLPLVYVIGVDENGACFPTGAVDPNDWWAQMTKQFDEVAPDLEAHVNVTLDTGESVVGLAFLTDRAPYVLKNPSGGAPEFEVPMRSATGTRSANRAILMRLLSTTAARPNLTLLKANLNLDTYENEASTDIAVHATIFVETTSTTPVLLPRHDIVGRLDMRFFEESETISLEYVGRREFLPSLLRPHSAQPEIHEAIGVRERHDGILITGPGTVSISFSGRSDQRTYDNWTTHDVELAATLSFGMANHALPINVRTQLRKTSDVNTWEARLESRFAES